MTFIFHCELTDLLHVFHLFRDGCVPDDLYRLQATTKRPLLPPARTRKNKRMRE